MFNDVVYVCSCVCTYLSVLMCVKFVCKNIRIRMCMYIYRKSGNFRVKNFHAIIFRVKIFSYASRPYENILTTKIFQ